MNNLDVIIQNCYGINKMNYKFEFDSNKSTYAIYAPNGIMKTSFANVFSDYSKSVPSSDLIHPEKESMVSLESDGMQVLPESVFVIKPFDKVYKSDKLATLLANEELKDKYDAINKELDIVKMEFAKEVAKLAGSKIDIVKIICDIKGKDEKEFYSILIGIEDEINQINYDYSWVKYKLIFDEKILGFLNTGDFKSEISDYILKYDEMIDKSEYLKKGFNHYNAETIQKNLETNGFFKVNHSIKLRNGDQVKEVTSGSELMKVISKEKENVLNSPELKEIFTRIDKKITNAQLREFRDYLFANQELLTELADIKKFKEKVILSYVVSQKSNYDLLVAKYKEAYEEIEEIVYKARSEETKWESVIQIFNQRFFVPFVLTVVNKEDAVLNRKVPSIGYNFDGEENIDEDLLYRVLSQGEKRALYLLNIIFEIESRRIQGLDTLYIIDDIADSFDYKNKYAIIEYLKDLTETTNFTSIILTHNFDFYRTVQEKIGMNKWEKSLLASRLENEIKLEPVKYKYISNPLKNWKDDLDNPVKLIASITFARNICEYLGDDDKFKKLTALLHIKNDTKNIKVSDIEELYKNIFKDLDELCIVNGNKKIYDMLFENANAINREAHHDGLNLERKILLSIAIRLRAEEYMITQINDEQFVTGISTYQTGKLFGRYKRDFPTEIDQIKLLERVSIMTPENIHVNSFMFEPILDMSDKHLVDLYSSISSLSV
ncbi:MAG: hypothetical protein ACOWWH_00320 [Eubacteriaceae bacterium]